MAHYGLRVRNRDSIIQIDDRFANLVLTQVHEFNFDQIDASFRPEATDSETVNVPDKPHVVAIQSISTNTTFVSQLSTYSNDAGGYSYIIRPTDNISCSCRVFVFTGFNADTDEKYGLRVNGSSGPAFVSGLPYMRVAGQFSLGAGDSQGSHTMSDSSRDYAASIMSFSSETRQMQGQLPGGEGTYYYDASLCRGVQTDGSEIVIASDVVSLIGGGAVDTGRFQPTSVLVLDVTGLY